MIPRLLLRVLCGEAEMLMSLTCLSASKFNHCCFLKHSIIKLPDLNLVTFFTSRAHPLIVCSMINGEILVKGFWLDVRTINRDQFSTSNSSLIIFFLFLEDVGFWFSFRYNKEGSIVPCIIIHHPCPHPPRSANTGHTWIPRISVGKYQEFQGWYTRTVDFLLWTQASY